MHRNCRGSAWISRPPRRRRSSAARCRRPLVRDTRREGVVTERVAPGRTRRSRPRGCVVASSPVAYSAGHDGPDAAAGHAIHVDPRGRELLEDADVGEATRPAAGHDHAHRPAADPRGQHAQVVARDPVGDDRDLPGIQRLAPAPKGVLSRPTADQDEVRTCCGRRRIQSAAHGWPLPPGPRGRPGAGRSPGSGRPLRRRAGPGRGPPPRARGPRGPARPARLPAGGCAGSRQQLGGHSLDRCPGVHPDNRHHHGPGPQGPRRGPGVAELLGEHRRQGGVGAGVLGHRGVELRARHLAEDAVPAGPDRGRARARR